MKTIAIISQKGGSGKTTLALNLAVAAHLDDQQAIIADLDEQASRQTRIEPGLPGSVTTSASPRIAAVCRDRIAVGTPTSSDAARIFSPKPGSSLWQTSRIASGVTSRGDGPVPPVVQIRQQGFMRKEKP